MKHFDAIFIGGGAAGFFGAVNLALLRKDLKICILEKSGKCLSKVRISGGGRCNVTHGCFDPDQLVTYYPRGRRELLGPFHRFQCRDTMQWFRQHGVPLKTEQDGRVFPVSDDSADVIRCLEGLAHRCGVLVETGVHVTSLSPPPPAGPGHWQLDTGRGAYTASSLVVTSGSSPSFWKVLGDLGLVIVPAVPSLFTFQVPDKALHALSGVSVPTATLTIPGSGYISSGPLLVTHWGLSGPAVLKMSAFAARELHDCQYRSELTIAWQEGLDDDDLDDWLSSTRQTKPQAVTGALCPAALPQRLWKYLLARYDIPQDKKYGQLSRREWQQIKDCLLRNRMQITGKSTFKEEFVTAGGVSLKEIDFRHFRARKYSNLYLAGEVLDIDAVTGGFNFQAAWTGGWTIAQSIAGGH